MRVVIVHTNIHYIRFSHVQEQIYSGKKEDYFFKKICKYLSILQHGIFFLKIVQQSLEKKQTNIALTLNCCYSIF